MSKKISLTSLLANIHIQWFTLRRGTLVGSDAQGNRYYKDDKRLLHGRERRWVIYSGEPEASKVPAEWHGWLHHTTALPITPESYAAKTWIKPHRPNVTGTSDAYFPAGDARSGEPRPKATGDYQAWQPAE